MARAREKGVNERGCGLAGFLEGHFAPSPLKMDL